MLRLTANRQFTYKDNVDRELEDKQRVQLILDTLHSRYTDISEIQGDRIHAGTHHTRTLGNALRRANLTARTRIQKENDPDANLCFCFPLPFFPCAVVVSETVEPPPSVFQLAVQAHRSELAIEAQVWGDCDGQG